MASWSEKKSSSRSSLRLGGKFVVTPKAAKRFPFDVLAQALEQHGKGFLRATQSRRAAVRGGVTTYVSTARWKQYGLRIVTDLATKTTTIGTVGEMPVKGSRYR